MNQKIRSFALFAGALLLFLFAFSSPAGAQSDPLELGRYVFVLSNDLQQLNLSIFKEGGYSVEVENFKVLAQKLAADIDVVVTEEGIKGAYAGVLEKRGDGSLAIHFRSTDGFSPPHENRFQEIKKAFQKNHLSRLDSGHRGDITVYADNEYRMVWDGESRILATPLRNIDNFTAKTHGELVMGLGIELVHRDGRTIQASGYSGHVLQILGRTYVTFGSTVSGPPPPGNLRTIARDQFAKELNVHPEDIRFDKEVGPDQDFYRRVQQLNGGEQEYIHRDLYFKDPAFLERWNRDTRAQRFHQLSQKGPVFFVTDYDFTSSEEGRWIIGETAKEVAGGARALYGSEHSFRFGGTLKSTVEGKVVVEIPRHPATLFPGLRFTEPLRRFMTAEMFQPVLARNVVGMNRPVDLSHWWPNQLLDVGSYFMDAFDLTWDEFKAGVLISDKVSEWPGESQEGFYRFLEALDDWVLTVISDEKKRERLPFSEKTDRTLKSVVLTSILRVVKDSPQELRAFFSATAQLSPKDLIKGFRHLAYKEGPNTTSELGRIFRLPAKGFPRFASVSDRQLPALLSDFPEKEGPQRRERSRNVAEVIRTEVLLTRFPGDIYYGTVAENVRGKSFVDFQEPFSVIVHLKDGTWASVQVEVNSPGTANQGFQNVDLEIKSVFRSSLLVEVAGRVVAGDLQLLADPVEHVEAGGSSFFLPAGPKSGAVIRYGLVDQAYEVTFLPSQEIFQAMSFGAAMRRIGVEAFDATKLSKTFTDVQDAGFLNPYAAIAESVERIRLVRALEFVAYDHEIRAQLQNPKISSRAERLFQNLTRKIQKAPDKPLIRDGILKDFLDAIRTESALREKSDASGIKGLLLSLETGVKDLRHQQVLDHLLHAVVKNRALPDLPAGIRFSRTSPYSSLFRSIKEGTLKPADAFRLLQIRMLTRGRGR